MSTTHPVSRPPTYFSDLWRLAAVVTVLFFVFLGNRPLGNPDEGRYAEIPREMAATGDYTTPRLNGVKYFEKPPLVYWLTASAIEVMGLHEFAVRFWPAFFGVAGTLLTYAAARSLYDRLTGIFSAVVLATSIFYYGLSRLALLDGVVSVLIAAALFSFVVGVRLPVGPKRRWLFWCFYAAMGLAALAKGLIGLALPCAVIGLWVLLLNRWKQLWPFYPASGTLIVCAIAAPWHVLAARANPDFLYFYFVHEHYLRFTTKVHDRAAPWWYFGPILLAGLFPWVVFLFQALPYSLAGWWRTRRGNDIAWFLFLWLVFILLFFSKSQSKLPPYILPVFPAAAVLIGHYLAALWKTPEQINGRLALFTYAGLALALGSALPFIKILRDLTMASALRPWQLVVAATLLASGAVVGWLAFHRRIRGGLIALAAGTAVMLIALNPAAALADKRSTKSLALMIKAHLGPTDQVYSFNYYFQDLPVYLNQLVNVVGYQGELEFGVHAEPETTKDRFIDQAEFIRRWNLPTGAFVVVRKCDADVLLARRDFPHVVVAEFRDQILISNRRL